MAVNAAVILIEASEAGEKLFIWELYGLNGIYMDLYGIYMGWAPVR